MKRKHFFWGLLLITAANSSLAQETISLTVVYEFRYVRDLAKKDNPYIYNMALSLGKTTSRYCTEREYKNHNKSMARLKQQQQKVQPLTPTSGSAGPVKIVTGSPTLFVGRSGILIKEEVMKNMPGRKMAMNGIIGTNIYTVETALPAIKWTLQPEKKTIDKYTCQRAMGQYAGRVFEAWFAPDLPYPDGPWKLSGLPGLILEARDTTNEVAFTFKTITRNDDAEAKVISLLNDGEAIKTNLKSYNRSMAAFATDPEAIMAAERPNTRFILICNDASGTKEVIRVKKYNPVEKD